MRLFEDTLSVKAIFDPLHQNHELVGKLHFQINVPHDRQLYVVSNSAKGNYQALLAAELLFNKEKMPRVIWRKTNLRKTALKFTKVYSYILITKAHHIKLKFYTVLVNINMDIVVEFHFDSCESSQDMAFSATLLPSCLHTHSKLSVSTIARSRSSSSLLPSEMMFISPSQYLIRLTRLSSPVNGN